MKFFRALSSCPVAGMLYGTLVSFILALAAPGAGAAVLSWSGSGGSANWNDSANWGFAGTPTNGDTLIFPGGAARLVNTNNIAGLSLNQIRFAGGSGGYVVSGNSLTLTNGIEATNSAGGNLVTNSITLATPGDFGVDVGLGATLTLAGVLSGSVGVVKNGTGVLILSGALSNTYGGSTTVNGGQVLLSKAGVPPPAVAIPGGTLFVGNGSTTALVSTTAGNELGDSVNIVVKANGAYSMSGSDTIGSNIVVNAGGSFNVGSTILTMTGPSSIISTGCCFANITGNGDIIFGPGPATVNVSSGLLYITPHISGSSSITKSGDGDVYFLSANSYTGLTMVASGILWASNYLSLGTTDAGTVVSNGATLGLVGNIGITNEPLTLNGVGAPTFAALDCESTFSNIWAGPITLNADSTMGVVIPTARLRIIGPIGGPGGLTQMYDPGGFLRLEGTSANTYGGLTVVAGGTMELKNTAGSGTAIPNSAVVKSNAILRLMSDFQLYQPPKSSSYGVTLENGSWFDLAGFSEWIGPLSICGAQISAPSPGSVYLNDTVSVIASNNVSQISGNAILFNPNPKGHTFTNIGHFVSPDLIISASLTSAGSASGLVKTGDGEVALAASNSFIGSIVVNKGNLWAMNNNAFGNSTNVVVNSGGTVFLYGALAMAPKPLSLSGSGWLNVGALRADFGNSSWNSNIVLAADASVTVGAAPYNLTLNGGISGPGGPAFNGPGTVTYSGSAQNTYAGTTTVNGGVLQLNKSVTSDYAVPGPLVIGDGVGGPNADVVRLLNVNQIANASTITIANSGLLDENGNYEGIGGLNGSGNVAASGLLLDFYGSGAYQFDGVISGAATISINDAGTQVFNGPNTYTGPTFVNNGILRVNGSQPQSPVTITVAGTLGGSGVVGNVSCGGALSPGASPGALTVSNLAFTASGKFVAELNGPLPGIGYDQLIVRGTGNLATATLQLNQAFTSPVALGQQFTLIDNDAAEPFTGIFNGLPNGATVNLSGLIYSLVYNGGTGNDLVLTLTNIPGGVVSAISMPGNGGGTLGPDSCATVDLVFTNLTGLAMTGVTGTLYSATENVMVTQPSSAYGSVAAFSKGTNSTHFQISILPSFVCGRDINLSLAVSSGFYGTFFLPFTLHTGGISASPSRYDNSTITNILDVGTIESTNVVTGFNGLLAKATVSLWLTHPLDSDLNISLISPDGITVPLSIGNGSGANFGAGCSPDANRTTFDDSALVTITAGSSPFVGSFQPQSPLAAVNRTSANGNWRLRITDSFGGSLGALRCWSLFLYPATCPDGGGACALCPIVLTDTLTTNSPVQNNRLLPTGVISTCGAPKPCPGTTAASNPHYHAYPFYNGRSNACVTVTLSAPCGLLFSAAYLGEYDPVNLCNNYLADEGNSVSTPASYSFNVSSNSLFTVVVNETTASCPSPYTLTVSGEDCTPILSANALSGQQLRLQWPTLAGGYQLESSVSLSAPAWATVTNLPIAHSNQFNITNSYVSPPTKFYRLHKP